ncbi:MAG: chemotaxis protein CheW [Lachnospiraceae bacterium]|nr:chemotaxis protein CheW [Lachnospiraceae bacterium]
MNEIAIMKETTQYITIMMADEIYGIDIKYIDNIVRMQHITRVPQVAKYIKGVINLRGEVIPVFSLRLKMGLEEIEERKTFRIIILKIEGNSVGIIVDEVREVVTLENEYTEKVYYDSNDPMQNFLSGIGKDGEKLISLLDINEVVADRS